MTICEFNIKTFGQVCRERRLDLRLTQKELATLSGVTESTIHNLETGNRYPMLDTGNDTGQNSNCNRYS